MNQQWSVEQANEWHRRQPWITGCNFIPSTAINQLEMWQASSFDPATLERELGWAAGIGMNSVRTYLHDLAYEADPAGFKDRLEVFIRLADRFGIRPLLVFFDDCWNTHPQIGPQPAPKLGVHNSGWVRSPGMDQRNWPQDLRRLKRYVQDIMATYAEDERIYGWDLFNEPGNNELADQSITLLEAVYEWAWEIRPHQPLTVGYWHEPLTEINEMIIAQSDIMSFHHYSPLNTLEERLAPLRETGRPMICTEWLARTRGSLVQTHLPMFRELGIGCYNWGLVAGKTNTIYPWGSPEGGDAPDPWFHDLFHPDGKPYQEEEAETFRQMRIAADAAQTN